MECLLVHISDPHDSYVIQPGACELLEVSHEELGWFDSEISAIQVSRFHPEIALMMSGRVEQIGGPPKSEPRRPAGMVAMVELEPEPCLMGETAEL